MESATEEGLKFDGEKLDWSVIPLEILEPLVAVFVAGAKKYGYLNCMKPFENGDRRFFAAAMRHTVGCQLDPLAVDTETGCYEAAEAAWNHLIRLHHARKSAGQPDNIGTPEIGISVFDGFVGHFLPVEGAGDFRPVPFGTLAEATIFDERD